MEQPKKYHQLKTTKKPSKKKSTTKKPSKKIATTKKPSKKRPSVKKKPATSSTKKVVNTKSIKKVNAPKPTPKPTPKPKPVAQAVLVPRSIIKKRQSKTGKRKVTFVKGFTRRILPETYVKRAVSDVAQCKVPAIKLYQHWLRVRNSVATKPFKRRFAVAASACAAKIGVVDPVLKYPLQ